ncbi:MAG: Lcl C-terminal domain-containing protein [Planctomycetota bacterium]|jgi:hypothetical protein
MQTDKSRTKITVTVLALAGLAVFSLFAVGGSLEPSAPPGPTMRSLADVYDKPVWYWVNKQFVDWPGNSRYAVCDNGTAGDSSDDMVLDKETGLVWTRDANAFSGDKEWQDALTSCRNLSFGERKGWRLPTIEEIGSLLDTSQPTPLPSGHPFINVQSGYWSCTTYEADSSKAYGISAITGWVAENPKAGWAGIYTWPVRGGNGYASGNW